MGQSFGCPFEPGVLKRQPVFAAQKVVVQICGYWKIAAPVVDVFLQRRRYKREAAVADVLAVLVPPRCADIVVLEELVAPYLRVGYPAIPLDVERVRRFQKRRNVKPPRARPAYFIRPV